MTDAISRFLTEDHRRCDFLLAACEKAVADGDWPAADTGATGFLDALLHHFSLEEDLLFPAVEQANPAARGPTGVMRMEHAQMRSLLDDLSAAVRVRDRDTCLGVIETLHMIGQQHNAKEEGILYPLSDRAVPGSDDLVRRMQAT